MIITFLGTGTSQGVPIIGCNCEVCKSKNQKDNRLRSSIHIEIDNKSIIIDTGPDFRQQMLREDITSLDAVIFTHHHKDHVAGMDDIRSFNFLQKKAIPIYANDLTKEQLLNEFPYVFNPNGYGGAPRVHYYEISNNPFEIEGITISPVEVMHHQLPVLGFRILDFTYITDANYISVKEIEKIKGSEVLVINALQKKPHISHFTLNQAIDLVKKIKPGKAYLTHISHKMGLHDQVSKELPENTYLAYDGLKLTL